MVKRWWCQMTLAGSTQPEMPEMPGFWTDRSLSRYPAELFDLLGQRDPSSSPPGCWRMLFLFPHNCHQLPEGLQDIWSIFEQPVWNSVGSWSWCTPCSALSTSVLLCRPYSEVLPGWPLTLRDFLSPPMSTESSENWRGPCRSMIFFLLPSAFPRKDLSSSGVTEPRLPSSGRKRERRNNADKRGKPHSK